MGYSDKLIITTCLSTEIEVQIMFFVMTINDQDEKH